MKLLSAAFEVGADDANPESGALAKAFTQVPSKGHATFLRNGAQHRDGNPAMFHEGQRFTLSRAQHALRPPLHELGVTQSRMLGELDRASGITGLQVDQQRRYSGDLVRHLLQRYE